jgi:hypothetical protein
MRMMGAAAAVALLVLGGCGGLGGGGLGDPNRPPRGFEVFFSGAQHNYRRSFAELGEPVRRGALAERFELRDGDCGGSDCGAPRYRASIREAGRRAGMPIGEDAWYGWSFRNETIPAFGERESLRLVFGSWIVGDRGEAALRLIQLGAGEGDWATCDASICAGPSKAEGDVVLQLEDLADMRGWGPGQNRGYVCRLFDMDETRGRWVDMVLNTNFSPNPDGYVRMWVDGELKCDYRGPVVSRFAPERTDRVVHRHGIFSSWTRRWEDQRGAEPKPTLIAYYDEFRSGRSREEVDVLLLERAGRKPRD